ncbi:hypothetical protein GCM10022409_34830 [Hymenobacter glaciei]|uniref:Uncharacterized protein n=1 Tax=Hymenobacter glaciei TaxID=877209 RepID=A0ABP7UK83_9BACT
MEIGDIAIHDFIVELAWRESIPKADALSVDGYKKVTSATVEIYEAGFGWSKNMPAPGAVGEGIIKCWDHFIKFEKCFIINLTIPSPGGVLEKVGISRIIPVRIAGVFDTRTLVAKIDLDEF